MNRRQLAFILPGIIAAILVLLILVLLFQRDKNMDEYHSIDKNQEDLGDLDAVVAERGDLVVVPGSNTPSTASMSIPTGETPEEFLEASVAPILPENSLATVDLDCCSTAVPFTSPTPLESKPNNQPPLPSASSSTPSSVTDQNRKNTIHNNFDSTLPSPKEEDSDSRLTLGYSPEELSNPDLKIYRVDLFDWKKHLLNPDGSIKENFESDISVRDISERKKNFCDNFQSFLNETGSNILGLIKIGCVDKKIRQLDDEISRHYEALEKMGYAQDLEKPSFPYYLLADKISWFEALYYKGFDFTFLIKDLRKEIEDITKLVNYFFHYPHVDQNLVAKKRDELYGKISDPLISLAYIRAFVNNAGGAKDALSLIEETSQEILDIFTVFQIKEPEKQSAGLSLSMKPQEILQVLRAKFLLPSQIRGAQLVLDGPPRRLQNGRLICYGIALLQCLANFLPLWRLTAINGVTFTPSQNNLTSYKINQVLEEIGKCKPEVLDVIPLFNIKGIGDSRTFILEIFGDIEAENILQVHDFVGVFHVSPYKKSWFMRKCHVCKKNNRVPCCFSVYSRTALIVKTCNELLPVLASLQVLDIEAGKYLTYELYAFTFGGDGHQYAFVKRANGKWYKCNDSEVEEVEQANVPVIGGFQKIGEKFPQVAFYLRSSGR